MAQWPSIRPGVDLELFRDNADNHAEIGCWVFLAYPFDHSRAMHFEVVTQLSKKLLTQLVASALWPAPRIA
jgi:hypothetical protein